MTGPAAARPRPPKRPLEGAEWLAARLSLAVARTRRFTQWWLALGGLSVALAFIVPAATGDSRTELETALSSAARDTAQTALRAQQLRERLAKAESLVTTEANPAQRPRATVAPRTTLAAVADSGLATLELAIATAQREQTRAAYLALADVASLRYGPRMRTFADSLRRTTQATEVRRLGLTIVQMAEYRRDRLAAEQVPLQPGPVARVASSAGAPDSLAARARVKALGDSIAAADSAHNVALAEWRRIAAALDEAKPRGPARSAGVILLAVFLLGLAVRVGLALLAEMNDPTVAHSLEAERSVGAPVLTHVRDGLPEGALRFRPSGVDPFRVLYLALTATGTRTRSVIVVGPDAIISAAVAARLAIAAAADHRNTLVVESDPDLIALARIFRDQPEPGLTDVMAGAFAWREVARPVGSSDGLSLQMIPAGTTREDSIGEARETALASFANFREQFELSIMTVALADLGLARELLPDAPVILAAALGETTVNQLAADAALAEAGREALHSVVLWDAPRPTLLSRAELAAQLSKRKGRTPGGSFKAVQEAIKKPL